MVMTKLGQCTAADTALEHYKNRAVRAEERLREIEMLRQTIRAQDIQANKLTYKLNVERKKRRRLLQMLHEQCTGHSPCVLLQDRIVRDAREDDLLDKYPHICVRWTK